MKTIQIRAFHPQENEFSLHSYLTSIPSCRIIDHSVYQSYYYYNFTIDELDWVALKLKFIFIILDISYTKIVPC